MSNPNVNTGDPYTDFRVLSPKELFSAHMHKIYQCYCTKLNLFTLEMLFYQNVFPQIRSPGVEQGLHARHVLVYGQ